MHELALSRSLVAALEEEARRQAFSRVQRVTLELGRLGHVDAEALAFCFDVATRATLAEGAALVIEHRAGRATCVACGAISEVEAHVVDCPACGSPRVLVDGGDEMRIRELEVC
jgi:hydrogenase nickel incorporation protein HypA/HybF